MNQKYRTEILKHRIAFWLICGGAAFGILLAAIQYPFYFDDAFISFRITENIKSGIGPYLFDNQAVYTSTSLIYPYLNLLPAWLHGHGWTDKIPLWNGCWMAIAFVICFRHALKNTPAARPIILLIATIPLFPWLLEKRNLIYGNGGLETTFYMAGLSAFLLVKNWRRFSPWLMFIRPEGILAGFAVLVESIWSKDRKESIRISVQLGLAISCWLAAGWILFDSPLPQSILAKANHLIDRPNEIYKGLSYSLFVGHVIPMAAFAGAVYMFPDFRLQIRLPLIWMILYLLFFSFGAAWWPWYLPPLFIGFWFLSMASVFRLSEGIRLSSTVLFMVAGILLIHSGWLINRELPGMAENSLACQKRMKASQEIVACLRTSVSRESEILLEPMGMMVWFGPELKIRDYPGLSDPETARLLQSLQWKIPHRLTDPKTVSVILDKLHPEVLVLWPEESAAFQKISTFRNNYLLKNTVSYFPKDPRMDSVRIYREISR